MIIKAVEAKKHSSLQDNSQNSSLDCVNSLRKHLKEKVHQEIQMRLERFYSTMIEKGKYGSISHFVSHDKILESKKDEKGNQLKRLTRGIQQNNQAQPAQQSNANRPAIDPAFEDYLYSDYQLSDDEPEVVQVRRSRRTRMRTRRQQEFEEEYPEEQDEEVEEIKKDIDIEDDEEEQLYGEERKDTEKKTRRLLIDEDDEEEEQLFNEIRRSDFRNDYRNDGNTSIVTRQRAQMSGRRNRDLVTTSALNQRASLNPMPVSGLRSGRTRAPIIEERTEDAICVRCGLENAKFKCSQGCGRIFHPECARRQGRDSELGIYSCFFCVLKRKKGEKVMSDKLNREWCNDDYQVPGLYIPQVGDQVVYIHQAHEEFILKHFDVLRYKKKEVFPFEKINSLLHDNTCKITNIKYSFPFSSKKTHRGNYNIVMKLVLEVREPAVDRGKTFQVSYFRSSISDFIVPKHTYMRSITLSKQLKKENQIRFRYQEVEKIGLLSEISPLEPQGFGQSHWCSLHVFDHSEEGLQTRKSRSSQSVLNISPWDVIYEEDIYSLPSDQDMTQEYGDQINQDIAKLENSDLEFVPFIEEVDKRTYSHYPLIIPFEMNLNKIKNRAILNFYRHKESMIADIRLIKINCIKFNQEEALISSWAAKLENKLLELVGGSLDVSNLKKVEREIPAITNAPARNRNKRLIEEDSEEEEVIKKENKEISEEELEYDEEEAFGVRTRSRNRKGPREPIYDERQNESSNSITFGNPEYKGRLRNRKKEDYNEDIREEDENNQKSGLKLKLTRKTNNSRAKYEEDGDEYGISVQENGKDENGAGYRNRLRNKKRSLPQYFEDEDQNNSVAEQQYLEEKKLDNSELFSNSEDHRYDDDFKEQTTKIRITRSRTKELHQPKQETSALPVIEDFESRRYPPRSTRTKNPMLG